MMKSLITKLISFTVVSLCAIFNIDSYANDFDLLDLRGLVKDVVWHDEALSGLTSNYKFDLEGKLNDSYYSDGKLYVITTSENKSNKDVLNGHFYYRDEKGNINYESSFFKETYIMNSTGNVEEIIVVFKNNGKWDEEFKTTVLEKGFNEDSDGNFVGNQTVSITAFDQRGNWIERNRYNPNGSWYIEKREISYHITETTLNQFINLYKSPLGINKPINEVTANEFYKFAKKNNDSVEKGSQTPARITVKELNTEIWGIYFNNVVYSTTSDNYDRHPLINLTYSYSTFYEKKLDEYQAIANKLILLAKDAGAENLKYTHSGVYPYECRLQLNNWNITIYAHDYGYGLTFCSTYIK